MLKVGQMVTIFEDPITETRKEGKAVITRIIAKPVDTLQLCEVKFADDGYETLRQVNTEQQLIHSQRGEEMGDIRIGLLKGISQGDKPADPNCKLFRFYCWLSHPQPDCSSCKYLSTKDSRNFKEKINEDRN